MPNKSSLSMKKIVSDISKYALLLNEVNFTPIQIETQWLGYFPASDEAIKAAEKKINCSFPVDYINFLKTSNGFPNISNATTSTFLPVEEIDLLVKLDEDLVEIWGEDDPEYDRILRNAILIGGLGEEQQILLIPQKNTWACWKFASWIPGKHAFNSFEEYLLSEHDSLKKYAEGLSQPKAKIVADFSLREAVFQLNWQAVYDLSAQFLTDGKERIYYYNTNDLYALMLLASHRLGNQEKYILFLQSIGNQQNKNDKSVEIYLDLAKRKQAFHEIIQQIFSFEPQKKPDGLKEIEQQIKENRKDLLKEKNAVEKINYQLSFLFSFGNTVEFIKLYNANLNKINFQTELNAAAVFAYLNENEKAKRCIENYEKIAKDFMPFTPYLNEKLLKILENK